MWWDDSDDEDERDITFYRPDGTTEMKTPSWCRSNGFFQIEGDMWSGAWYYQEGYCRKVQEQRLEEVSDEWKHDDELIDALWASVKEVPNKHSQALEEEDYKFTCPLQGCFQRFETQYEVDSHVRLSTGKGHVRYREEHMSPRQGDSQRFETKKEVASHVRYFSTGDGHARCREEHKAHYTTAHAMWFEDSDDDEKDITFYRPDGDTEMKTPSWCRSNGFFQVEDDLWSGPWYYRHFPEKRKEETVVVEEKSCEEIIAECKRQRRAELLDEIYGTACENDYNSSRARAELQRLDEEDYEFACPLQGCTRRFETREDVEWHFLLSTGKGHVRYREEHFDTQTDSETEEDMDYVFKTTNDRLRQTDIRLYFPRVVKATPSATLL